MRTQHRAQIQTREVEDVVDVLIADHPAPRVVETLHGKTMVAIEGGTQALRRTINARLEIVPGENTTVSVPSPFGAVILKAAAYQSDTRDRERHLQDAALLLAVIEDPLAERAGFAGSIGGALTCSRGLSLTPPRRGGYSPRRGVSTARSRYAS